METTTTWAKLKDGSWGLRGDPQTLTPGARVTVTRKDGTTSTVAVGEVVWRGADAALAAVARDGGGNGNGGAARTGRGRCACTDPGCECRTGRCRCSSECNCRGGPIWDC